MSYAFLILLLCGIFWNVVVGAPPIRKLVFQTFVLSDGSVFQCYGRCQHNRILGTYQFNVTRCEGDTIRISCKNHHFIQIRKALVGPLNAGHEICEDKLKCSVDIQGTIQDICRENHSCKLQIPKEDLNSKCGFVKYLSLEILFTCEQKLQTTATIMSNNVTASIATLPIIHKVDEAESKQKHDFFWLMTVHSFMKDGEFMKSHKLHLVLAAVLSVLMAMVIGLCLLLEFSRRKKRNKQLLIQEERDAESLLHDVSFEGNMPVGTHPMMKLNTRYDMTDAAEKTYALSSSTMDSDGSDSSISNVTIMNNNNYNVNKNKIQSKRCNEYKERFMGNIACNDCSGRGKNDHKIESDNDNDYGVYGNETLTPVVIEKINKDIKKEHSILETMDSNQNCKLPTQKITTKQSRPTSLSNFPQPPKELLEDLPNKSTPNSELIPPPQEYQQTNIPSLLVTFPTPIKKSFNNVKTSIATKLNISNNVTTQQDSTDRKKPRSCLKQNASQLRHPNSVQLTRKFQQVDRVKWNTPPVQRKYSFNHNNNSNNKDNIIKILSRFRSNEMIPLVEQKAEKLMDIPKENEVTETKSHERTTEELVIGEEINSKSADQNSESYSTARYGLTHISRDPRKGKIHVIKNSKSKNYESIFQTNNALNKNIFNDKTKFELSDNPKHSEALDGNINKITENLDTTGTDSICSSNFSDYDEDSLIIPTDICAKQSERVNHVPTSSMCLVNSMEDLMKIKDNSIGQKQSLMKTKVIHTDVKGSSSSLRLKSGQNNIIQL